MFIHGNMDQVCKVSPKCAAQGEASDLPLSNLSESKEVWLALKIRSIINRKFELITPFYPAVSFNFQVLT